MPVRYVYRTFRGVRDAKPAIDAAVLQCNTPVSPARGGGLAVRRAAERGLRRTP